jgi:alpha-mannosidase
MFHDLTDAQIERLPRYRGELLCTQASGGFYTSQAAMKRWNRRCEQRADAAERMRVMTDCLDIISYPREALKEAWIRFLYHQMHDDLTGTSIPEVYCHSRRDYESAFSDFTIMLNAGMKAFARYMDTRVEGVPCLVFNPLCVEREDIVTVTAACGEQTPEAVRVFDAHGTEVPSELIEVKDRKITVAFLARVPAVGCAVFDIRKSTTNCSQNTGVRADESSLENDFYRIQIDGNGDVCSVFDKKAGKELLSAPARLQLLEDYSPASPAWDIRWEDISSPPKEYVSGPILRREVHTSPLRSTLCIERSCAGSRFTQILQLAAGEAGKQLEIETIIEWETRERLLKASFPLTVSNPNATYDIGLGLAIRGNNSSRMHEVPAQQWASITDEDESYTVSIMNDCKYGWDKPADNELRLTLLHTPRIESEHVHQRDLEIGQKHRIVYALHAQEGKKSVRDICHQAARLNQPLQGHSTDKHPGSFGKQFSFAWTGSDQLMLMALKKAERTEDIIVRVRELEGLPLEKARIYFKSAIKSAHEVDGQEIRTEEVSFNENYLEFDISGYQPRAFAVQLAAD